MLHNPGKTKHCACDIVKAAEWPLFHVKQTGFYRLIAMFHDLLTIRDSFKQFTDFNGVFQGFLSKILFLCTRETLCEPNAMGCLHPNCRGEANVNYL